MGKMEIKMSGYALSRVSGFYTLAWPCKFKEVVLNLWFIMSHLISTGHECHRPSSASPLPFRCSRRMLAVFSELKKMEKSEVPAL